MFGFAWPRHRAISTKTYGATFKYRFPGCLVHYFFFTHYRKEVILPGPLSGLGCLNQSFSEHSHLNDTVLCTWTNLSSLLSCTCSFLALFVVILYWFDFRSTQLSSVAAGSANSAYSVVRCRALSCPVLRCGTVLCCAVLCRACRAVPCCALLNVALYLYYFAHAGSHSTKCHSAVPR